MNKIVWSDLAFLTFTDIAEFLSSKYSLDAAIKFDEQVDSIIQNLKKYKELCPAYKKRPSLRKCIVNKNTSLLYRIDRDKIHLVTFFDNRGIHSF